MHAALAQPLLVVPGCCRVYSYSMQLTCVLSLVCACKNVRQWDISRSVDRSRSVLTASVTLLQAAAAGKMKREA